MQIQCGGGAATAELNMRTKWNEPVIAEVVFRPIIESGRVTRVVGIARDITDRRHTEGAIRESREMYEAMMETSLDAVIVIDLDFVITEVYQRTLELHGFENPHELVGKSVFDLISADDRDRAMDDLCEAREYGSVTDLSYMMLRNDDSLFVSELNASLARDSRGEPRALIIAERDITDRRLIERSLEESEEKYSTLVELSPEGIVLAVGGLVVFVNRGFCDMFGFEAVSIRNKNLVQLISESLRDTTGLISDDERLLVLKNVSDMVKGKTTRHTYRVPSKKQCGTCIWIETYANPIMYSGKIAELLVFRDVTERKNAEEELARVKQEKDAQIVQSAKLASLGEMATGIAHEINQPLNVIKLTTVGMQRFIRKGKKITSEMLAEELESINDQVERMRAIIDHLRTFARPSSNVECDLVDMNVPLMNCFKFVGEQMRLQQIEVHTDLQELPRVLADSNKLEQVFLNIISNARDAMHTITATVGKEHKNILTVHSFVEDSKAVVTLSDTGGGIPAESRARVFEPFFTTKEAGRGTGLGLSISYNIIKEFDGGIDFSVDEGVGTTFVVALPIASQHKN